jgi:DNA-binding response OmpR family regulator
LRRLRDAGSTALAEEAFRVLVVDGDQALAEYVGRVVQAAVPGALVSIATDAEQTIAMMRATPVHLLFVDLHLPHTSGVELAMYLRGAHLAARCRIVALSAGAQWADVGLLRQLGVTDFVRKGELLSERLRPLVHHAFDELQYRRRITGG